MIAPAAKEFAHVRQLEKQFDEFKKGLICLDPAMVGCHSDNIRELHPEHTRESTMESL